MPTFSNLPGVYAELQDGNLGIIPTAVAPSVLVLGTASDGPGGLVQMTRPAQAKAIFGSEGTLARGILEVADGGAQNIWAYRIGATGAKLEWIGNDAHTVGYGITIETVFKDDTAGENYSVTWDDVAQHLTVWNQYDEVVYDSEDGIDTGEVLVYGETTGTPGDNDSFGEMYTGIVMNVVPLTATDTVYTVGTDGLSLTRKELYVVLEDAYAALENVHADFIIPMDVYLDDRNAADDITSGDYLGYLKKEIDDDTLLTTYTWADTKLNDDYHEVNFAYQLANYCYQQTKNEYTVLGGIGVRPYVAKDPVSLAKWVGKLPTKSIVDGTITVDGSGLLGNRFMSGIKGTLNGPYAGPGFYATEDEFLDGVQLEDELLSKIDIGAYISIVQCWTTHYNSFDISGLGYTSTAVTDYIALVSTLVSKSAPTNKPILSTISIPVVLSKTKLDLLAGAHYVLFQQKTGSIVVIDAPTAAQPESDYQRLSTIRICDDVISMVRRIGNPYIGEAQTQQSRDALKAAIDSQLNQMQKAGYLTRSESSVSATADEQVQGFCTVELLLVPAFELRRIRLIISLARA